jgi:hypothetical protein
MSIGGEKSNVSSPGGLRVGAVAGKALWFNPTSEEFKEKLGFNSTRVPEYKSIEDGVKHLKLDIWFQEPATGKKYRCGLRLADKEHVNENSKVRYVDHKGNSSIWVESESELPSFIRENDHWIARVGEVQFTRFLKAHTDPLRHNYANWERRVDWRKLINGDVSELNKTIGADFTTEVLYTLSVRMGKVGDVFKAFQSVYSLDFLPGDFIRYVDSTTAEPNKIFANYLKQLVDPKYGCREFFGEDRKLMPAHDYDPSKNPAESNAPMIIGGAPAAMMVQPDSTEVVAEESSLDEDILSILEGDDDENSTLY